MPEIKNTFLQGYMNKDLDERLIPNGQYRHAENVDVSISESSDVGTVQNILGNTRADLFLNEGVVPVDCACVGSVVDENNNKLYWFVKSITREAIVQYDEASGESVFVAVDMSSAESYPSFLKFTGKPITGINVIDNFLFWTDGDSEPKKINIEQTVNQNNPSSINVHTTLHIDGEDTGIPLSEDHVTVIRRKPSIAPSFHINSSSESNLSPIFEKIFPRFCFRYKYRDGEYSAFGPFTDVVFNPEYIGAINELNAYSIDEPYNKAMVNSIESIDLYDFVPADIPDDVVQVDILYKQENSNVVYSIANIKHTDPEWSLNGYSQGVSGSTSLHKGKYTITTENVHAALPENQTFRLWDNVPRKAVAQEMIGNRLVYGNYTQGYDIQNTVSISANAILRTSQDFGQGGLPSLKSLRDYQVGIVFGDKYGRETPVFTSSDASVKIDWNNLTFGNNASKSLMFTSQLTSEYVPEWADYYKFYVKQTSGEYYNLVMDKAYIPQSHTGFENEGSHAWISFASADRDKLVEDDFIIVKKVITTTPEQISYNNRYKILDIKNEAPDAIKYVFPDIGVITNGIDEGVNEDILAGLANDESLFSDSAVNRIDTKTDHIHIRKGVWISSTIDGALLIPENADGDVLSDFAEEIYISWEKDGIHSERYKASTVSLDGSSWYKIKLEKKITTQDAQLADGDTATTLADGLQFKIERRADRSPEDFSGKFFVKIKRDSSIATSGSEDLYVESSQEALWLYGKHNSGNDFNEADGIVNSANQGIADPDDWPSEDIEGVTGKADSPDDWEAIHNQLESNSAGRRFFIDNMPFVSSNPNTDSLAKESGEGWIGAQTKYGSFHWGLRNNAIISNPAHPDNPEEEPQVIEEGDSDTINIGSEYTWKFGGLLEGDGSQGIPLTQEITEEITVGVGLGGVVTTEETFESQSIWGMLPIQYLYATVGGYGLAPRPILPLPSTPLTTQNALINGLEGIITSNSSHIADFGHRKWLPHSIYEPYHTDGDQTYGDQEGKYFMHLSFLAPGIDLHEGFESSPGLPGVDLQGPNSIANKLQGIWGGGIFTRTPDSVNLTSTELQVPVDMTGEPLVQAQEGDDNTIYPTKKFWVEFEGHYDSSGNGLAAPPSMDIGKEAGYDTNYETHHDRQWDPAYSNNGTDAIVDAFVTKLSSPESKFRFSEDPNGEVYKILSVSKKKIYNHTSWRKRWIWDADANEYISGNNSVEEAAVAWASKWTENGDTTEEQDAADELKQKIVDFGAAHNRRICFIIEVDKNPSEFWNPVEEGIDMDSSTSIEFLTDEPQALTTDMLTYPAVWETEPQQLTDLNIYYEASKNIPVKITGGYREIFAPAGSRIDYDNSENNFSLGLGSTLVNSYLAEWTPDSDGRRFTVTPGLPRYDLYGGNISYDNALVRFYRNDGSYTTARIHDLPEDEYELGAFGDVVDGVHYKTSFLIDVDSGVNQEVGLSWYNCFSFGDGVESNRIRDKFNDMQIFNGARASATLEEPYSEEHRKHSLIYSGIYNSNSGINNLNQFIQAQKITKDLNPTYGSIQKLFSRNTDLVALCEDRVLKILANKDALFNADGNPQLIATENVLGQAVPFIGDYGISRNPESFASESYRAYFADKQRRAILRLSMDGLTPISEVGMRDWFRDNMVSDVDILGSYDDYSKQYNVTIKPTTYENIIKNATVQFGTETEEFSNPNSILNNSNINIGVEFNQPNIFDTLSSPNPPLEMMVSNQYFSSQTQIRNHHEILSGSIVPYIPEVPFEEAIEAEYVQHFTPDAYYVFVDDFTNGLSFTEMLGGSASNTPQGITTREALLYNPDGEIESLPLGSGWTGTTTPDIWVDQGKIRLGRNIVYSVIPNSEYELSISSPTTWALSAMPPWNTNPETSWSSYVPTEILEDENYVNYEPAVTNNTIFNGEEVRVYLECGQIEEDFGGDTKIRVELFDGATPISEIEGVSIHNPGSFLDQGPNFSDTPWGRTHYVSANMNDPALGSMNFGFQESSIVDFGTPQPLPNEDSPLFPTAYGKVAYFKFTNGTENSEIVVNRLVVKVTVLSDWDGDTSETVQSDVLIDNLTISKIFSLKTVPKPEQPFIPVQLPEPAEDIPAWASVTHSGSQWQATPNIINIFYGNEMSYGPATTQTEVTASNGEVYITGESNGVVDYNQYPGDYVEWGNYTETSFEVGYPNSQVSVLSQSAPGYITQDITDNPFVVGNWYLIDVEFSPTFDLTTLDISDIRLYGVVPQDYHFMIGENHEYLGSPSGQYPNGWFGEISGTYDVTSLKLMPADINDLYPTSHPLLAPRLRGIFQLHENSFINTEGDLNTLTIEASGATLAIKRIVLVDITNQSTGGSADSWNINESNYTPINITQPPELYYDNGMVNWNTHHRQGRELTQNFANNNTEALIDGMALPPQSTVDGWNLSFDILPNPDNDTFGVIQFMGDIYGGLDGYLATPWDGNGYSGVKFENINEVGSYVISFKLDGSQPAEVTKDGEPYNDISVSPILEPISPITSTFQTVEEANKLVFLPHEEHIGFIGSIDNIKLIDATNYFTTGSVTDWSINNLPIDVFTDVITGEQIETASENYIQWQDGTIFFENAPSSEILNLLPIGNDLGVPYISQNIGHIPTGTNVEVSLDFIADTGNSINVLYFNNEGRGFEWIVTANSAAASNNKSISTEVNTNTTIHINNTENPLQELSTLGIPLNTLIIRPWGSTNTTCSIDNISLRKTVDIDSKTVSFNEDVKGWVSFKSFIPEDGISLSSKYFTMHKGGLWQHNTNDIRGSFYGVKHNASITAILNDSPSTVKNFNAINYEGSQAYIPIYADEESLSTYNTIEQIGWKVEDIHTDLQDGTIDEFIKKEGKWFNYIRGLHSTKDVSDFNFQGIGIVQ